MVRTTYGSTCQTTEIFTPAATGTLSRPAITNDVGGERNEEHDQRRVHELHLGWLEGPGPDAQVHRTGLHDPGGCLLIEQHPEEGDESEDGEDAKYRLDALDGLLGMLRAGAVQDGATLAAVAQRAADHR